MKTALWLSLAMLFSVRAQERPVPNLAGVWQSKQPHETTIRISSQGPAWLFEMVTQQNGTTETTSLRLQAGADENRNLMHGAPMISHVNWEGSTLVVKSVATIGGKELRMTDRWILSDDGNSLTFRELHQYGSEQEREDTVVLQRQPDSAWKPPSEPKPAEEVYKNIQIFRGVPAARLPAVMNNFTRWLGVQCDTCHVAQEFDKDDKPAKQTARRMMLMVRAIGKDYFGDANPVTCWTCHRGALKPESLPR